MSDWKQQVSFHHWYDDPLRPAVGSSVLMPRHMVFSQFSLRSRWLCAVILSVGCCFNSAVHADDENESTVRSSRRIKSRIFPGSKFNLHVLATESFVDSLLSRTDTDGGFVNDFVMGAQVNGWQSTNTQLKVNFKPNRKYAQIDFELTGSTNTNTVGTTQQAVVNTVGRHSFFSTKSAFFNGRKLLTRQAFTTVSANNMNAGVRTVYSGLPIIGEFADQQARQRIAQSRSQTEQIAASRIVQRVNPRFNTELDRELVSANKMIRELIQKWLSPRNLDPSHTYATTSDKYLRYSASIKGEKWPVDTPIPADRPHGNALSVYIHESLFEEMANKMELNGLEISDRALQAMIQKLGGEVTDETDAENETPDTGSASSYTLVFDKKKPVFVDAQDDQLTLNLRFAVKPIVGQWLLKGLTSTEKDDVRTDETALPMQKVSIPLSLKQADQTLALNPGPLTVVAAKQPTSITEDDSEPAPMNITGQLIKTFVQSKLQTIKLPDHFELPLADRTIKLKVRQAVAKDGWIMIALD